MGVKMFTNAHNYTNYTLANFSSILDVAFYCTSMACNWSFSDNCPLQSPVTIYLRHVRKRTSKCSPTVLRNRAELTLVFPVMMDTPVAIACLQNHIATIQVLTKVLITARPCSEYKQVRCISVHRYDLLMCMLLILFDVVICMAIFDAAANALSKLTL